MAAGALVKGEPQPRLAQLVVQGAPNVQHIFQGAGDERAAGLHVRYRGPGTHTNENFHTIGSYQ